MATKTVSKLDKFFDQKSRLGKNVKILKKVDNKINCKIKVDEIKLQISPENKENVPIQDTKNEKTINNSSSSEDIPLLTQKLNIDETIDSNENEKPQQPNTNLNDDLHDTKENEKPKKPKPNLDTDYIPKLETKSKTKSKSKKVQKHQPKPIEKLSNELSIDDDNHIKIIQKTIKLSPTKKRPKKKRIAPLDPKQPKITEYLRRSKRVTAGEKRKQENDQIFKHLDSNDDTALDYLKILTTEKKGRGIYASKFIKSGQFIVEYAGELLSVEEGVKRELEYSLDPNIGSYIYFFVFQGKKYCIDATKESGRFGRLLNHSKMKANCKTRLLEYPEGMPRLIIESKRDIKESEELLYDYGDRSEKSLKLHPWLKE